MQRIEIHLDDKVLKILQDLADLDDRSRKNFIERIVIKYAMENNPKGQKK